MIRFAAKISRTATRFARTAELGPTTVTPSPPWRRPLHHDASDSNTVALQMINYALSHARSHKSDESYGQSQIVLEQCLSSQPSNDSKALVFMAMSTLLSERGNYDEAIEKLEAIQNVNFYSIAIRVTAMEALIGLYLELGKDNTLSEIAEKCLEIVQNNEPETRNDSGEVLSARAKAIKGLVELVHGDANSAESVFRVPVDIKRLADEVQLLCQFMHFGDALSYGEFLHATKNFELAKETYHSIIQKLSEKEDIHDSYSLGACNMSPEEVLIAAMCALGQLEGQSGNFGHAEKILSSAVAKAEEHFGSHHPKIGVILTCIALMYRHKSMKEGESSLLIQEGLYTKAIKLLNAPPLETDGEGAKVPRSDIIALARGAYAEVLCVQQKRKDQADRMKRWAESAWRNRRLSLAEALEISDPNSKPLIIDTRICRALSLC